MNKTTKIALVAVPLALAAAYPASAWVIGKQVEAAIGANYQLLAENPSAKIVQRDYQRGLFGATETVTIELFGEVAQLMASQQQAMAKENPEAKLPEPFKPIRITVRSDIRHGPLPGFSTLAAAVVDSELVLDGDVQKQVSAVIGDQKPLQVHTEYRFDGGGLSAMKSPAFSTHWAADKGEGRNSLAWDGISMSVNFEKGMKRYSLQAEAPKLQLRDSQGGSVLMSGLRLEGTQQRVFDDEPLLYAGAQKFTLAEVNVSTGKEGASPVVLKQVAYAVDIPVNGDFIDIMVKLGAESLQVEKQNYGPAHYDVSVRHLHARTTLSFYRTLLKLYSDPALQVAAQSDPKLMLAPLAKPALELLKFSPEISIDRVSFRSPEGDATLAARVKLKDFKDEDLGNPLMLLAKLDASAEISLPEAMVSTLAGNAPAVQEKMQQKADEEVSVEEAVAARNEKLRQQLAVFIEQGLVLREGSLIKSKLAFSNGQMSINGKPFNPMAMGAPGKPM
jgi:uncharacterized protein YdgA (DUF945 family)